MDVDPRDLLDIAVGEPPHQVTAMAVRRTARRRAVRTFVASLAVVLAAGATAALAAGAIGNGTTPTTGGHAHARAPSYYVGTFWDAKRRQSVFAVRARATGAVTAVIRSPLAHANCGGGNVGVAASAGQTYFMTCVTWLGKPAETRIYRFGVTRAGRIGGYSLVPGGVLKGLWASNIAAAPDGSEVAVQVFRPDRSGGLATNAIPVGILVINTKTGHSALWRSGPYVPGAVQFAAAADLSLTRHGRELVVLEERCHRSRSLARCGGHADMQVRAFSQAARGGSLQRGRVLLRESALAQRSATISNAFITPDGSAVTAAVANCPSRGACVLSVARYSAATGKTLRVLYQVRTGDLYRGYFERFFSTDPSGRYLILDAGAGSKRVNGWIDHGRLVPLTPANGDDVGYETW